jgi:hypothetical protein
VVVAVAVRLARSTNRRTHLLAVAGLAATGALAGVVLS